MSHVGMCMCRAHVHALTRARVRVRVPCRYCTKDRGLPHYQVATKGVTEEQLQIGQDEYSHCKLSYLDNKMLLTKANLFGRAHTFYMNKFHPEQVELAEVLVEMINSNKYMLSAVLMMQTNGQMRESTANAYWSIVMGQKATKAAIKAILYTAFDPALNQYTPNLRNPEMLDETSGTASGAAGPSGTQPEVESDDDE